MDVIGTELAALRLSCWGMAVSLGWCCFHRLWDRCAGTPNKDDPVRVIDENSLMILCTFCSISAMIAYTGREFGEWSVWMQNSFEISSLSVACRMVVIALLTERMSYHPKHSYKVAALWVGLAHIARWGSIWLA